MKLFTLSFLILGFVLLLQLPKTIQGADCITSDPTKEANATALVISKFLTRFTTSSGACVTDPSKAPFLPFKIPTYDDLKSLYYDQAKTTASIIKHNQIDSSSEVYENSIDLTGTKEHLYYINGNLTRRSGTTIPQEIDEIKKKVGVVFVKGNFSIQGDIRYTGGLVFVVSGNVYIKPSVVKINAIIISSGTIYTAGEGCASGNLISAETLTIDGSLISLDPNRKIQFCRKISSGTAQPGEIINHQPKYLVILRNILSDTVQRWSEITGDIPALAPGTSPGPISSPTAPAPAPPTHLIPSGTISAGAQMISWDNMGAASYALRVDDTVNPWNSVCAPNPGDVCTNNITNQYQYNFQAGHTYSIWVHSISSTGVISNPSSVSVTVTPTPTPCPVYTVYTDNDHDQYGSGNAQAKNFCSSIPTGWSTNNTDCNDGDVSVWQSLSGYRDADGDTYTTGSAQQICSGASLPGGYRAAAKGADCNDANASVWQNLTGYVDSDRDTYGAGGGQQICSGASLPSGYSTNNTDCNDGDANVHPNQIAWFTTAMNNPPSGVNAFDYNCDSSATIDGGPYKLQAICGSNGPNQYPMSNAACNSAETRCGVVGMYNCSVNCGGGDNECDLHVGRTSGQNSDGEYECKSACATIEKWDIDPNVDYRCACRWENCSLKTIQCH